MRNLARFNQASSNLVVHYGKIKSHYLAANANSGSLTASLIKFDKKKAAVAVQWRHLNALPLSVGKQIKRGLPLSTFCLKMVFLANQRTRVQLILVHCTSSLVGSKGRPRIVLLWDPRGAGQGVCGPRGGAFTNTADAENLNCKGGKNRAGWMADILG